MKQLIIYAMTLMSFVLPVLFFVVLDRDEKTRARAVKKADAQLPLLFRVVRFLAALLELLGLGKLYSKLMPAHYQDLNKQLHYAGMTLSPSMLVCTQAALLIVFALLTACVTSLVVSAENRVSIPIAALIAAMIGGALPGIIIGNIVQERQTQIMRAIPYSIDLIASAMRGGLDFSAAIRFYVKLGIKNPLTDEYSQMLREMELGVGRITALQNMAERIQLKEFTSFAAAVALGTELGAPLTDTMEIQGEEMRKARFALAETKAQRAPSLMLLPMALFILPAVFIIILTPVFIRMQQSGVSMF